MLGDGPVGSIDICDFRNFLSTHGRRALSDENLLDELCFSWKRTPDRCKHGISLLARRGSEISWLVNEIVSRTGGGKKVTILLLDPQGRNLFLVEVRIASKTNGMAISGHQIEKHERFDLRPCVIICKKLDLLRLEPGVSVS